MIRKGSLSFGAAGFFIHMHRMAHFMAWDREAVCGKMDGVCQKGRF